MDDPANSSWVGSPASYRAAWAHVREIFAGLPASFVWAPTAAAFASDSADRFYPGDGQVDWVAADGYNGPGCPSTGGHPGGPRTPRPRAAGGSCRTSSATSTCGAAPTASR